MTDEEFLQKLQRAVELDLEYYSQPKEKPNLNRDQFLEIVKLIRTEQMSFRFASRETLKGKRSKTGEEKVFHLNFEIRVLMRLKAYYVKGYFYDKDVLKGVFIHSFREN